MQKSYSFYTLSLLAVLCITFQSCNKKVDGIDNNVVIETPYTLYYSDSAGALYNTNDGIGIKKIVFTADGSPSRALCLSGTNIIWVKNGLYESLDNGTNFNACNYFDPTYAPYPQFQFLVNAGAVNQSLILNATDENRLYISTSTPKIWVDLNGLQHIRGIGVAYSEQHGNTQTWAVDTFYDNNLDINDGAGHLYSNLFITSFTQLKNNTVVGFDSGSNRTYTKANLTSPWFKKYLSNTDSLPHLNAGFTLGHFNNLLVAIDNKYGQGAYYSYDTGQSWQKFTGLPAGRNLYCASSPFDQVLLVGTDSMGVYKLTSDNSTNFVSANIGLENLTTVRGIVGKSNVYKNNGLRQQYIYMATSTGLYKSVDLGQSWIRVQQGNLVSVY